MCLRSVSFHLFSKFSRRCIYQMTPQFPGHSPSGSKAGSQIINVIHRYSSFEPILTSRCPKEIEEICNESGQPLWSGFRHYFGCSYSCALVLWNLSNLARGHTRIGQLSFLQWHFVWPITTILTLSHFYFVVVRHHPCSTIGTYACRRHRLIACDFFSNFSDYIQIFTFAHCVPISRDKIVTG